MIRKDYLLFIALLSAWANGQTVSVLEVTANDLAYSGQTNRLYVSVSAAAAANASTLAKIDPATAQFEDYYPIGDNPGVMAVSGDGQKIYVGLKSAGAVRPFDVTTHTIGADILLGSNEITGDFYAEDIEVMPGNPNTIAVARRNLNFAPKHEGVAIYDDGVARTNVTRSHTGSNDIEFVSASEVVGFNNESTEYKFRKWGVNASGIALTSSNNNSNLPAAIGGPNKFVINGTKAFFSNGKMVDFSAIPIASGTFENAFGPVIYDNTTNTVCYASYDMGGNISLKFFNPDTQALLNEIPIPQATGSVKNLVGCGANYYAFNTADKVVIVNYALGAPNHAQNIVTLYPNPVKDLLYIHTTETVLATVIFNQLGQKVMQLENLSDGQPMDLTGLATGTYIIKLDTPSGQLTQKLVKM
ncbi:hypothetical protein FLLO111716_01375 [Flavobacterium longum]|uniref:T9SS type A sorting domain-containing protein n=1 Tax=Flavobacterium longum TaxID=1299340 RepID=UPI0039E7FD90